MFAKYCGTVLLVRQAFSSCLIQNGCSWVGQEMRSSFTREKQTCGGHEQWYNREGMDALVVHVELALTLDLPFNAMSVHCT